MQDAINSMPKDKRGFIIINQGMTPNIVKQLISTKPAGFVIDPDLVKGVNNGELALEMFQGIRMESHDMPVIDLNGLQKCDEMFEGCNIKRFEGFENFDRVTNAHRMFQELTCSEPMPKLDMRNVRNASNMFVGARLNGGFSVPLDMRNVQDARSMFYGAVFGNFPLGNEVNLPNA